MAYENNVTEVIKDIEKGNRGDVIRVSKITDKVKGTVNCDIRMYYEDDGELKPTKKGVRVNAESAYELVEALMNFLEVDELENLATAVADKLCDEENPDTDTE